MFLQLMSVVDRSILRGGRLEGARMFERNVLGVKSYLLLHPLVKSECRKALNAPTTRCGVFLAVLVDFVLSKEIVWRSNADASCLRQSLLERPL